VVARAWSEEAFKERLLAEPGAVLREQGLEIPAGVDVRVIEDTAEAVHLVLPPRPTSVKGDLSDEELERVAGGYCALPTQGICGLP
jgi:hypothetical protein